MILIEIDAEMYIFCVILVLGIKEIWQWSSLKIYSM